jgi:hypothetical protein
VKKSTSFHLTGHFDLSAGAMPHFHVSTMPLIYEALNLELIIPFQLYVVGLKPHRHATGVKGCCVTNDFTPLSP